LDECPGDVSEFMSERQQKDSELDQRAADYHRADYGLLQKQHFKLQEVNSKMHEAEYDDFIAFNNIAFLATISGKPKRSWPSVLCKKALEYAAVAVALGLFERWCASDGYWNDVRSSQNGTTPANGTGGPLAEGLHQVRTGEAPGLLHKVFVDLVSWHRKQATRRRLVTLRRPLTLHRKPTAVCP
ncbi:hypothetical protein GNI_119700, partial [Gregarina niphandrodes]